VSPDNDKRNPRNNPRKAGGKGSKGKLGFSDYRIVRIELTSTEKDELREFLAAGEFPADIPQYFLDRGLSVKLAPDNRGHGILATATNGVPDTSDAGLTLTARGSSKELALGSLYYKDVYICGDEGWGAAETQRGGAYDDVG